MLVPDSIGIDIFLNDIELWFWNIENFATFAQHRVMSGHLPWTDANSGADVCDVINSFESVFKKLFNQPIEALNFAEMSGCLAIKWMLKGYRRKSFEVDTLGFRDESGVGHEHSPWYGREHDGRCAFPRR